MGAPTSIVEFPCGRFASRRLVESLQTAAVPRSYARGEFIVHEGDAPDFLGVVLGGRVKVVKHAQTGREVILHLLGPGSVFGVVPVLDGQPYPASVVAVDDSEVGRVAAPKFLALLRSEPALASELLAGLGRRVRALSRAVVALISTEVSARLASALLEAAGEAGVARITRQELADLSGTTVETAIRVTRQWEREGLVALSRGRIQVRDRTRLTEVAGR